MNLDNINKYKALKSSAQGFKTLKDNFKEKINSSNSRIDKVTFKFANRRDDYALIKTNIIFECEYGYYGDSSVQPFNNGIDKNCEFISEAFIHVLNENKDLILTKIGEYLELKAKDIKHKVEEDLKCISKLMEE